MGTYAPTPARNAPGVTPTNRRNVRVRCRDARARSHPRPPLRPRAAAALRLWHAGSGSLVGDAVYATSPNLRQGGARGGAFAKTTKPFAALLAYERIRRPKAERIVRTARWSGKWAHVDNSAGRAHRNAVPTATPS